MLSQGSLALKHRRNTEAASQVVTKHEPRSSPQHPEMPRLVTERKVRLLHYNMSFLPTANPFSFLTGPWQETHFYLSIIAVLRTRPRAWCMPGKGSITQLHPHSSWKLTWKMNYVLQLRSLHVFKILPFSLFCFLSFSSHFSQCH